MSQQFDMHLQTFANSTGERFRVKHSEQRL